MKIRVMTAILAVGLLVLACPAFADWRTIGNSINAQLDATPTLGDHSVDLHIRHGQVELTGTVASQKDSNTIEDIARHTKGVDGVVNNLKINGALSTNGTKEANFKLSTEVVSRIAADPNLSYHNFAVEAKGGLVKISGKIASEKDRTRIEQIALGTPGVTKVDLELDTLMPSDDNSLAALVRKELQTNNGVDLAGIDIVASDGVVTFKGERSNHRDIDDMLSLALMVPGVRDIRSEMHISGNSATGAPDSRTKKSAE